MYRPTYYRIQCVHACIMYAFMQLCMCKYVFRLSALESVYDMIVPSFKCFGILLHEDSKPSLV